MRMTTRFFGLVAAILLVPALIVLAQDKKDPPPKGGRQLPANWGKLGLSDKQKNDIYSVQSEYKTKIDELQKQINELRKKEKDEMSAVLTDAQKARLKEIVLESVPGEKPAKDKNKNP